MDVSNWLSQLKLSEYQDLFKDYKNVKDLIQLDEGQIKALGVRNAAHRARIASSLVILREKLNKANFRHPNSSSKRYSTSFGETALAQFRLQTQFHPIHHSQSVQIIPQMVDQQPISDADLSNLRRELEKELNQGSCQLSSRAWYHGSISRLQSESLLKSDGDFLVRDSSSGQPGDLVLSCQWKGSPLHFIITKVIAQPNTVYESIKYRLEDEPFDSVPDLVTCYVGSGKPISMATGARIATPVNRTLPLSYYSSRAAFYNSPGNNHTYAGKPFSPSQSPTTVDPKCSSPPHIPTKQRNSNSRPVQCSTQSLPRNKSVEQCQLACVSNEPSFNPSNEQQTELSGPPPKPSRIPFQFFPDKFDITKDTNLVQIPETNVDDDLALYINTTVSDINSAAEDLPTPTVQSTQENENSVHKDDLDENADKLLELSSESATLPRIRRPEKSRRPISETKNSLLDRRSCSLEIESMFVRDRTESEVNAAEELQTVLDDCDKTPTVTEQFPDVMKMTDQVPSLLDVDNFQSLLLPSTENKPLDSKTFESLSIYFEENSAKLMALHLLHDDIDYTGGIVGLPNTSFRYRNHFARMRITSGIELCTLPHGQQLRQDLTERTCCLRLFVAVTILICASVEKRAAMLNQWIEIAIESKTAFGNMYGFTGLILGLCSPQVQRLSATWHLLRQRHTQSAFTFETQLKPLVKLIADGTNPHAPNTTIPDLHSAILLWEANLDSFLGEEVSIGKLNLRMGNAGKDFGLDLFCNHLGFVRSWSENLNLYVRNSRVVLENVNFDEVLLDIFRTEFQMKFLLGNVSSRSTEEKYEKFEQILTALSERREPTQYMYSL